MKPSALANNLRPVLEGKKILLGVSGSIAAFKACDIVRGLREAGARVRVVLTDSAHKFVTTTTLETLSGEPVYTSLWDSAHGTHHIDAARWADLALIAPATANTIAKLALGLADDLLSTELLAFMGPVLVAPAMNPAMYAHPAVQANVATLASRGVKLVGPTVGVTSCGEEGLGRMFEPEEILEAVGEAFARPKTGKRILITLGPTRSAVDPVRYLTNRSSGRMGAALAWAAIQRGYDVTAVCGPTDAELPRAARVIRVTTAKEMLEVAADEWPACAAFISAAAVLDWDVKDPRTHKMKKNATDVAPTIELTPNADILATLSRAKRPEQFVLGFAAETEKPVQHALEKLHAKGCDAIFANDVSREGQGFESNENSGWWIARAGSEPRLEEIGLTTKLQLAHELIARIENALPHERARPKTPSEETTHVPLH